MLCSQCDGSRLHVGDRVVFTGDVPRASLGVLGRLAREEGLQVEGLVTSRTDFVVYSTSTQRTSDTFAKATATGARPVSADDFTTLLRSVCDRGRSFSFTTSEVSLFGKKVLVLGSRRTDVGVLGNEIRVDSEVATIRAFLARRGLPEGHQIRPSLGAAIVPPVLEGTGCMHLAAARGIPVFRWSDFQAIYG